MLYINSCTEWVHAGTKRLLILRANHLYRQEMLFFCVKSPSFFRKAVAYLSLLSGLAIGSTRVMCLSQPESDTSAGRNVDKSSSLVACMAIECFFSTPL